MLIDCFKYHTTTASEFIFTVDTTKAGSASDTFILQFNSGVNDVTIYWGDGTSDYFYSTTSFPTITHVYASSGSYQVSLDGSFTGLYYRTGTDKLKVSSIDNWGNNVWAAPYGSFQGCSNMTANYTDNPTLTGNMHYMFYQCSVFDGALEIDATNCTTMYQMFLQCSNLNSPITFLNSSSVTTTQYMFYQCTVLDQDISSLDITSLTTATNMMISSAFSTTNYDLLLVAWDAFGTSNVPFHAGTAQYSSGAPATARANMISRGWTITDGGAV